MSYTALGWLGGLHVRPPPHPERRRILAATSALCQQDFRAGSILFPLARPSPTGLTLQRLQRKPGRLVLSNEDTDVIVRNGGCAAESDASSPSTNVMP